MSKRIGIVHAASLNADVVLIELTNGVTVELTIEQILALHPPTLEGKSSDSE